MEISVLNSEQRDRILAAADKLARDLNNLGVEESFVEAHRLFTKLAEAASQVKSRQQILELMDSMPDLSWKDEQMCLAVCKYGKHLFRLGAVTLAAKVKAEMPAPPGGRKRAFALDDEKEVCRFVSDLIVKKVALPFAYERTAAHFGISPRTVRRLWEVRDQIAAESRDPDFDTTVKAVRDFLNE